MMPRQKPPTPDDADRMDRVSLAAVRLGVHPDTVRRYIAEGKLPAYRLAGGTNLRVRRGDVDALLDRLPTATSAADAS